MRVIATAGHVDHGKTTLIQALTGTNPDRWAEERRRGMTIGLGYAWTELDGLTVAFVDVPGHERFVPTMLAGAGPVPAALFVVAADEGWMPQSAEHLAALDALGVRHGLLAVTRADLADPQPAIRQAGQHLAGTGLAGIEAVAVSAVTGQGMAGLRGALAGLARRLPVPGPDADVRLWLDRVFTISGAGTVVTGTLTAGSLRTGDELLIASTGRPVRVRGLQALGETAGIVAAPARVAVNLRGVARDAVEPGDALLTPGAWLLAAEIDVLLRSSAELPRELMLHLGAAAVPVRVRPLGGRALRLRPARPLPVRVRDRALLRDPGRHLVIGGVDVVDVRPPVLRRRGSGHARAAELTRLADAPLTEIAESLLRRTGFATPADLRAMGLPQVGHAVTPAWLADAELWTALPDRLTELVAEWRAKHPLEPGMPVAVLARNLHLPDPALIRPLAAATGLDLADGRVGEPRPALPVPVEHAIGTLERDLAAEPFHAPDANRLAELRLGGRELGAAVRAGRLVRLAEGVYLLPDCGARAADVLAKLPAPFTLTTAKQALHTTRRVAVPLLEWLDHNGITQRHPDATRTIKQN